MKIVWILWKSISISLHMIGTIAYGCAIVYQALNHRRNNTPRNGTDSRAYVIGDFKYMTYWNLLFQFSFHISSLSCDIIPERRLSKEFVKIVDTMFHTVVFPLAMFVCVLFWFLCSLDENLVRNRRLESRYPRWYNHVTHTMIGPLNLLELVLTYHEEPERHHGLLVIVSLYLIYFFWVLFLGVYVEYWVYPFLEKLSWSQRIILAIICGVALSFYHLGCVFLSKLCWPKTRITSFKRTTY